MIAIKAAFVTILAFAAWSDARRFLIPNIYSLLLLLLGALAWVAGFPFAAPLWSHAAHFVLALGLGMLLFHFGWFGGGDVKLYAALASWFPLSSGLFLLLTVSLSGAAVVLLSIVFHQIRAFYGPAERKKGSFMTRRIAYGLAIAAGGVFSMLWRYS
ncbi:A24 family peptidase [Sphingopyxis macrogoltabida]|uniref:Prepilin type IV endopeptidase peptidase domain-containing protein n=1 Tax=Sphingopyxis macrogoltabida TaxID=33050 RepID=A0AAC9AVY9_SPHMC|nr:prepilin peptidase [Sphingopyxis macrogoltabida]ALJ14580.1 3-hydroxybutyryl-CoA dehydratase [Sphingopyxis macrogoltabida]AMU90842.1 hypothetical protein ATM17_17615 [Sphingopyxis macrogoltabida]